MTDRPILFSAPMVRALLAGTKTQTRRLIKNPEHWGCPTGDCPHNLQTECNESMSSLRDEITNYRVGDRLWVKETWRSTPAYDDLKPSDLGGDEPLNYLADQGYFNWAEADGDRHGKTRVSIFMPRWASRLTLTVTDVRVERLQDISKDDAIAEGLHRHMPHSTEPSWAATADAAFNARYFGNPCHAYYDLWNSINGAGAWEQNPWVVAISFNVEQRNIDQ